MKRESLEPLMVNKRKMTSREALLHTIALCKQDAKTLQVFASRFQMFDAELSRVLTAMSDSLKQIIRKLNDLYTVTFGMNDSPDTLSSIMVKPIKFESTNHFFVLDNKMAAKIIQQIIAVKSANQLFCNEIGSILKSGFLQETFHLLDLVENKHLKVLSQYLDQFSM